MIGPSLDFTCYSLTGNSFKFRQDQSCCFRNSNGEDISLIASEHLPCGISFRTATFLNHNMLLIVALQYDNGNRQLNYYFVQYSNTWATLVRTLKIGINLFIPMLNREEEEIFVNFERDQNNQLTHRIIIFNGYECYCLTTTGVFMSPDGSLHLTATGQLNTGYWDTHEPEEYMYMYVSILQETVTWQLSVRERVFHANIVNSSSASIEHGIGDCSTANILVDRQLAFVLFSVDNSLRLLVFDGFDSTCKVYTLANKKKPFQMLLMGNTERFLLCSWESNTAQYEFIIPVRDDAQLTLRYRETNEIQI